MLGAVVATYNLPGRPKLHFAPDVLADIFLGKITRWNDDRIAKVNPGVSLPAQPIVVVHWVDRDGAAVFPRTVVVLGEDAEATVIAHEPGTGKYAGKLGALRVRTDDGREFSVGSGFSDAQRESPPPVGTVITYRFRGLTAKGMPRFPSFLRIRRD